MIVNAIADAIITALAFKLSGEFSRRQIDDIFLIFPRTYGLKVYANCLLRRQFA